MNFKKILIASLLSLSYTGLSAQYNTLKEWYIGPTAGATMSTLSLTPKMVDKLYSIGKTVGFSTRYISECHFGFQVDLNYVEAGWKEDLYGLKSASNYSYARKLNFVEMPVLMHAYSGRKAARIFLNIGPKFSYLLSESEDNRDFTTQNDMLQHGKTVEKPFQYGLLGGVGLELHLKRSVLGLEGRYCYSLSNIFDDTIDSNNFSTSSIQVMSLNLYYYFQIGGK